MSSVCWEKREHFCSGLVVRPIDESQFPTQSPDRSPEQDTDADIGGGESTYSDVSLNPGLMPWDQPRGPQGQPAEWNPVPEPGLDARDVDGGEWDPASQLGSRPEGPADLMDVAPQKALPDPRLASRWHPRGPETWNEELKTGKYSPVLKEMKEDLEKAVPGVTGSEGHPASPPSSRTEAPADHTGPERGKGASRGGYYAWWSSRVQRKPVMKTGEAVHGGTKGTDQETVQKKLLQEGSSDTQPVSDRNAQAEQAAALPGVDVGKITKAAVGKELQKRHIPVVAVVSAALLSVLTLACIPMLWMWKKHLARKRERAAAGQAPPDTDCKRDQNAGKGRAELGEAAKEDALDQGNNLSIPLWWSFEAEFAELCRRISTDPSLQPACPSSSPADNISSVHTCSP